MTEHNKNEKGTNMTQQEILEIIVRALDSKRAEDIQVLRVHDLTILVILHYRQWYQYHPHTDTGR